MNYTREHESWTDEEIAELTTMTPREYEAFYPGQRSPASLHIKRRRLRDLGVDVRVAHIGRPPDVVVTLPDLPPGPSDDDLWAAYDKAYDVKLEFDHAKATREATIKIETDRPFGIVFMSDFHIGSSGVDTRALREDIELINTCDRLKVYVGGDGIDNFVLTGLANVHRDTAIVSIDLQFALFKSIIKKLLPSLLAVGTGNHDAWTKKVAGIDANLTALAELPILHTLEDTYLNLEFANQTYTIYRKHRPSRSSQTNEGHGVQHMFRYGERPFDVGVMEHHHTPFMGSFWAHGQNRWAIRTGSYKIRDGYALEWGFQHGGIGTPVVVFHPHRKSIVPFMSIPEAIEFLEA